MYSSEHPLCWHVDQCFTTVFFGTTVSLTVKRVTFSTGTTFSRKIHSDLKCCDQIRHAEFSTSLSEMCSCLTLECTGVQSIPANIQAKSATYLMSQVSGYCYDLVLILNTCALFFVILLSSWITAARIVDISLSRLIWSRYSRVHNRTPGRSDRGLPSRYESVACCKLWMSRPGTGVITKHCCFSHASTYSNNNAIQLSNNLQRCVTGTLGVGC